MSTFTVQFDEDEYRIVGPGGETGACVPYGQPAALAVDEAIYYCLCEADDETPVVYAVDSVSRMPTKTEDVDFVDSGDGIALVTATGDEAESDEEEEV